ncbi:MAG TPA: hypothetical protein VF471_07870 [Pseudoxanthomonas sp.]
MDIHNEARQFIQAEPASRVGSIQALGVTTNHMHVIFLHGGPASGKHTIGVKLSELTETPLFHNHLAVDAAKSLFAFGTPAFNRMRATIWRSAFAEAVKAGQSFIFTFNPESTVDPALISELRSSIESAGGKVHFVQLVCSRKSTLERMANATRTKFGKLTNPELFQAIEAQGGFEFPDLPDALLIIDTDLHDPHAAATLIAKAVEATKGDS